MNDTIKEISFELKDVLDESIEILSVLQNDTNQENELVPINGLTELVDITHGMVESFKIKEAQENFIRRHLEI